MNFRIIADDLSGACDCAAAFAATANIVVPVYLDKALAGARRYALDTDTRAHEAGAASTLVRQATARAMANGTETLLFKKIDSTLRGHIGQELLAALCAEPAFDAAVIAPAFPEQQRSLAGGKLFVEGRPIPRGAPSDLVEMMKSVGLRTVLLGNGPGDPAPLAASIAQAVRNGVRAVVVDAADAEDLLRLAKAIVSPRSSRLLVAGSAGLARALATVMTGKDAATPSARRPVFTPGAGPAIAVVGSFSQTSRRQLSQLVVHRRAHVVQCEPDHWMDQAGGPRGDALRHAERLIDQGENVVFAISGAPAAGFSRGLVRAMAIAVSPLLRRASALLLTGGDTARAVLDSLHVDCLDVSGELEPGISISRSVSIPATQILIKAGGFGDQNTLRRVFDHIDLHRPAPHDRKVPV